jgi:hypothetical protein
MARRFLVVLGVMALGAVSFAPGAQGAITVQKWESLTCKENADLPTTFGEAGKEVGWETAAPLTTPA